MRSRAMALTAWPPIIRLAPRRLSQRGTLRFCKLAACWRNRAAAARPARLPRVAASGAEASWGSSGGVLG